ncbi:MAG: DUF99 family protein [Candidatus Altiarchaeota archaeon]
MTDKTRKFYSIKDEVRIVGFDDGPFTFRQKEPILVVGAITRGGSYLDGVLSTTVSPDGLDSTERIVEVINKTRFKDLRIIMTDGLSFGGFNMVDLPKIFDETGLPAICVVREYPDFEKVKKTLTELFDDHTERWQCIENAGKPISVTIRPTKKIFIQFSGIAERDAKEIVKMSATHSLLPEPIRLAHLIAQGIVMGESKGKA